MGNEHLAAEQKTFSRMITLVARRWKADGFVRRGREFNRRSPEGVVQALGFQKYGPPRLTGVQVMLMGAMDRTAGRFGINFTIHVPEVYAAVYGRPLPDFVASKHMSFLHGHIDAGLSSERRNALDRPADVIAADVMGVYETVVVPLFAQHSSVPGIVASFERGGDLWQATGRYGEEFYGYCLAVTGERERAGRVLQKLVDNPGGVTRRDDASPWRIVEAAKRGWGIQLRGR